jgi:hypothetical protein
MSLRGLAETNETIAVTIALTEKKTLLVMKALPLEETEPYARAQLQVMRCKIGTGYRKQSVIERNRNRRSPAIDDRIADIEPHGYSLCRIEFDDPADIQRKSGVVVAEFDWKANLGANHTRRAGTARRETGFDINKSGPHFSEDAEPIEAQAALHSELALKTANVVETGGREVIQFALDRQVSCQIECQSASSTNFCAAIEQGTTSSCYLLIISSPLK